VQELSHKTIMQRLKEAKGEKFAIFCRSKSGTNARFKAIHPTLEEAKEVARSHAAEHASHGSLDFTYYVAELKYKVGIEDGSMVDGDA
jgi:hypothetical protein